MSSFPLCVVCLLSRPSPHSSPHLPHSLSHFPYSWSVCCHPNPFPHPSPVNCSPHFFLFHHLMLPILSRLPLFPFIYPAFVTCFPSLPITCPYSLILFSISPLKPSLLFPSLCFPLPISGRLLPFTFPHLSQFLTLFSLFSPLPSTHHRFPSPLSLFPPSFLLPF